MMGVLIICRANMDRQIFTLGGPLCDPLYNYKMYVNSNLEAYSNPNILDNLNVGKCNGFFEQFLP